STDFNPSLDFCGYIGFPGIKIRFNRNAFRYASSVIAQLLNQEIQNIQIPGYTQSLQEVNGYARLSHIMITNYQCPEHVALFPISHNQIGLKIRNFALSVRGQLRGQVTVLLPFSLCGTVCIDARQISMYVQLSIERNPYNNAPYIRMSKCSLTIGYLNIQINEGGIIGFIINNIFRTKIISQANETIPGQFCEMVPGLLDERVNSQLANIPQEISTSQVLPYIASLISRPKKLPDYCSSEICQLYQTTILSLTNKKLKSKAISISGVPNIANLKQKAININKPLMNLKHLNNDKLLKIVAVKEEIKNQKSSISTKTDQKSTIALARISNKFPQKIKMIKHNRIWRRMKRNIRLADTTNNNQWEQCANCDNKDNEILSYYLDFVLNRIQTCASDLALSTYLLGSSTTNYDLTFDLAGEFSPNTQGGTPFGSPVLQYPVSDSGRMLDLLISDYMLNTLLYHLHRKGIFSFRIGPEIPIVGDLLNLTCEIDFDLSVTENENDLTTEKTSDSPHVRNKRLTTTGTLLNLGICFGNIAPAIREKYPQKKVYIIIGTSRGPSIQFHTANNDTIVTDLMLDGFIFLDGTTIQVGHLRIVNEFAITVQITGNRIIGKAQVQRMEFVDVDETFGIPKEAFMNLSDLARGILSNAINEKLANGFPIEMPRLGSPINLYNIHLQIIKHALFISTDIAIPSLVSNPGYTGCFSYN
uniref:Lipid-binding serum glycoprotein C-terminal domain-containing protein n=1 Tax=Onchocerca volvulus TaxID=6282 RepID=A0A8R1TLB4_ONCVO